MSVSLPPARRTVELASDEPLLRARELIVRAIRQRWATGLLSQDPDGVFTAFLGAEQIERLMVNKKADPNPALDEMRGRDDSAVFGNHVLLQEFAQHLRMSPRLVDLMCVLIAVETDPVAARLISYLGGNQTQFTLTLDLVLEIIYMPRTAQQSQAAAMLLHDLDPSSQFRRLRYIQIDAADSRSMLAQPIRLHPRVTGWLLGQSGMAAELSAYATMYEAQVPTGESRPEDIDAVVTAFALSERLLVIEGPQRSGREMTLRFAAVQLAKPLLIVSGQGLGPDRLLAAFREAVLQSALLAFRDTQGILEGECLSRFRECLEVYPDTVALIQEEHRTQSLTTLRPIVTVTMGIPEYSERLNLWQRYLGRDSEINPQELGEIAGLYNLGISGIVSACQSAAEMAGFYKSKVARPHIARAVRQLFDGDLSSVANRVEVSQTWDDLVLPEDFAENITEILARIRYRNEVMGHWGMGRKLGKGLGLTMLFSGEPGTGKSMVAGLIAKELGLDLYVLDLSRVSSKWLGETEKNLSRAFDAAEAGHVLLLFDEAESILGRRTTEIRSSNDRYANQETNFVLARMEQFQGIAAFTTNMASAVEPAMLRRISVNLQFPFPDEQLRARLWERMIPPELPIAEELNFAELGERYEISGGFIRNIVLRAAFAAAYEGTGLTMEHMRRAASLEYRERGSLMSDGRLL